MPSIRRLSDSCVLATADDHATLIDPGFHTFGSGAVDLDSIGDVTRVLITHEHRDHVDPDFVRWLVDRRTDLTVHANPAVSALLADHGIEASTDDPPGVTSEDVVHERIPTGATPPNRAFTVIGLLTHPGDSYQPSRTAPVLALPLITPWGSATAAVDFARRLRPERVVPVHDFYLSAEGRSWVTGLVKGVLSGDGIEVVELDWGDGFTV